MVLFPSRHPNHVLPCYSRGDPLDCSQLSQNPYVVNLDQGMLRYGSETELLTGNYINPIRQKSYPSKLCHLEYALPASSAQAVTCPSFPTMSRFTCYKLTCTTQWGKPRQYWGMTELFRSQDQQAACRVRLRHHLTQPLLCLRSAVAATFAIEPQGGLLSKPNCLAQEAIYTAQALARDATARGACFSCPKLGSFLQNCAKRIRTAVKDLDGQAARNAVLRYAAGLDEDHPLRRHLAGQAYGDTAPCRVQLPATIRSGRSGRPGKSGKPGNATRKKQLKRRDYKKGSARHCRLKRGRDPAATREAENEKQAAKKKPAAACRT